MGRVRREEAWNRDPAVQLLKASSYPPRLKPLRLLSRGFSSLKAAAPSDSTHGWTEFSLNTFEIRRVTFEGVLSHCIFLPVRFQCAAQ